MTNTFTTYMADYDTGRRDAETECRLCGLEEAWALYRARADHWTSDYAEGFYAGLAGWEG